MKVILGVDAGGTKTDFMAADYSGKVLAEYQAGPSNYISSGTKTASKNLLSGLERLIGSSGKLAEDTVFCPACFGFAGYNSPSDLKKIEKILFGTGIKRYLERDGTLILNDTRIGLAAGSDKENAVIIICGTGSNCYGINQQGSEAKANGWDYILGDQGSGYQIGLKALQAIMKDYDGRGEKTSLKEGLLEELEVDIQGLIEWTYEGEFSKSKIASIAKHVCTQAQEGDRVAKRILKEEADEVLINIKTVVDKLKLASKDFDIVFLGGNFKCIEGFKSIIDSDLRSSYEKVNLVDLKKRPVEGALRLARSRLG